MILKISPSRQKLGNMEATPVKTGYDSVEEAYKDLLPQMVNYAKRHLFNTDYATDAAHDAFNKVVEYENRKPNTKVSSFILFKELKRAIRRINKVGSYEIPAGDLNTPNNYDELEESGESL